jgi:hypothetical protein
MNGALHTVGCDHVSGEMKIMHINPYFFAVFLVASKQYLFICDATLSLRCLSTHSMIDEIIIL